MGFQPECHCILYLYSFWLKGRAVLHLAGGSKKRTLSSYEQRLQHLPSASRMNLTVMGQEQGIVTYDRTAKQPRLQQLQPPLYLNYRCDAYQVRQA